MKPHKKYLAISVLSIFLMSTLSSCWVVIPHSTRTKQVHVKKDNGLHKGWYKQPKRKKHPKHKHKHKHQDLAPMDALNTSDDYGQTFHFRLDQPK